MIKGSERRIVVVERPEDPVFERAVFYVRVGMTGNGQTLSRRAQELCDRLSREERGAGDGGESPPPLPRLPVRARRRGLGRKGWLLATVGGLAVVVTALLVHLR